MMVNVAMLLIHEGFQMRKLFLHASRKLLITQKLVNAGGHVLATTDEVPYTEYVETKSIHVEYFVENYVYRSKKDSISSMFLSTGPVVGL